MTLRGECLVCRKIDRCAETSVDRALTSYTCPLFTEVEEPVYLARIAMMRTYGAAAAVEVMMSRISTPPPEGEDDEPEA